jgi:hypothetical protein
MGPIPEDSFEYNSNSNKLINARREGGGGRGGGGGE